MQEKMRQSVWRVIFSHRTGFDRIVHCDRFKSGKEFLGLWLKDGSRIILARKPANRVERREKVYDHEFGLLQSITAKDIATAVTIYVAKSRKNSVDQQFLVRICIVGLRPTSPMTSNHFPIILGWAFGDEGKGDGNKREFVIAG